MGKYFEIAVLSFKTRLIYKWDVLMKGLFAIIRICLSFILWSIIFSGNTEISGMTFSAMITYYVINSYLKLLDCSDTIVNQMDREIRDGTFTKYKLKPLSILCYFSFDSLAKTVFNLLINIPAVFVWFLIFHKYIEIYWKFENIICAILICLLGILFMILFNYFIGILCFQFIDISAANMIKNTVVEFLIGSLVPLILLPETLRGIMQWFPFYYISYIPSMLFIGKGQEEIVKSFIVLGTWLIIMFVVDHITYKKLQLKYEGVGI